MKKYFLLVLLLSNVASAATGSGAVTSVVNVGGGASGPTGTLIPAPLVIPVSSVTTGVYTVSSAGNNAGSLISGRYYPFGKVAATGGQWSVPFGKIAVCFQQAYATGTSALNDKFQFGYATATVTNEGSSVTGGVCYSPTGNCTNTADGALSFYNTTGNLANYYNFFIVFDATSATGAGQTIFPFFRPNSTNANMLFSMLCYQQ